LGFRKKVYNKVHELVTHTIGRITKKYYFEDYIRVYPDGIVFNRYGHRRKVSKDDINNFLNHRKFYEFTTQFVKDKDILDAGCGSGYGSELLKKNAARKVSGSDISEQSIKFAKSRYGHSVDFTIQEITDMMGYQDDSFDIAVANEVLEHIKEYEMEEKAIGQLKRVTRRKGLLIIGTPNTEMLDSHGFSFEEINTLFSKNFSQYCIFENAFLPFGSKKELWEERLANGKVGIVVSERINLEEAVFPKDNPPKIKRGIDAGKFKFADYDVDTTLLHNTHSWIVLAVNDK